MAPADSNNTRPRKPLSPYNLFYRYKRAKIIEANSSSSAGNDDGGSSMDKNDICQLVATPPGLEHLLLGGYPSMVHDMITDETRRMNVRSTLQGQLFAKDTTKKRRHRKSKHGYQMTFVEMNQLMVKTWKEVDDYSKSIFQELAEDGKKEYNELLLQYNKIILKRMNGVSPTTEVEVEEVMTAQKMKPTKKMTEPAKKKAKLDHNNLAFDPSKVASAFSSRKKKAVVKQQQNESFSPSKIMSQARPINMGNAPWASVEPLPMNTDAPVRPRSTTVVSPHNMNHSATTFVTTARPEEAFLNVSSIQPLPLYSSSCFMEPGSNSSTNHTDCSDGLSAFSSFDYRYKKQQQQSNNNVSVDDFMELLSNLE